MPRQALGKEAVAGMKQVFQTQGTVVIYPSSGTGAWEAALVNTLSPGDVVWLGTDELPKALKVGDTIEVEISGIGVLRNRVVAGQ